MDDDEFDHEIEHVIPATFFMFAGSDDHQQAAEVSNIKTFELPDPVGKEGGACTSALLQTLYRDDEHGTYFFSGWRRFLLLFFLTAFGSRSCSLHLGGNFGDDARKDRRDRLAPAATACQ